MGTTYSGHYASSAQFSPSSGHLNTLSSVISHSVTMSHKQRQWVSFDTEEPSSSPLTLPLAPSHRIPRVDLANVTSSTTSNLTSKYSDITSNYPNMTSNVTSKYPYMCSKYPVTSSVSSKYSVFDSLRHEERC